MKILYYYPNFETNMFQWQKHHFMDELMEYGVAFEILSPFSFDTKEQANEGLLKKAQSGEYDVFMTSYHEDYLQISTLKEIKKHGIATLLFCPDNLVVPYNHVNVAKYFDLVWLTSVETQYLFDRWGAKSIFLPYAANPYFLTFDPPKEERLSVGFIGTPHGSRIVTINQLVDNFIPVTVHTAKSSTSNIGLKAKPESYLKVLSTQIRYPIGRKLAVAAIIDKLGRNELHSNSPYYSLEEPVGLNLLSKTNSQYALTLSFTNANSTGVLRNPVKIVNLRNFELPMSGAIQFCEYSEEMSRYFEDEKEIVMYRSKEDFIDKARFYLDPNKASVRENIRKAARSRAEKDHTWHNRFQKIFSELGIAFK